MLALFHRRSHSVQLINRPMIGISSRIKKELRKKWRKQKRMGTFSLCMIINSYIEKQDFLSRVDHRQFEKERKQRERERIQRENEWRQRQH